MFQHAVVSCQRAVKRHESVRCFITVLGSGQTRLDLRTELDYRITENFEDFEIIKVCA